MLPSCEGPRLAPSSPQRKGVCEEDAPSCSIDARKRQHKRMLPERERERASFIVSRISPAAERLTTQRQSRKRRHQQDTRHLGTHAAAADEGCRQSSAGDEEERKSDCPMRALARDLTASAAVARDRKQSTRADCYTHSLYTVCLLTRL